MANILVTNSLTSTTVISFVQNRLREFNIDDIDIKPNLFAFSEGITNVVKAHFKFSFHRTMEEDLYYDEIAYEYMNVLKEIKSFGLESDRFKKLIFIVIKVLDQIIIESKEMQLNSLTELTLKMQMDAFNLL